MLGFMAFFLLQAEGSLARANCYQSTQQPQTQTVARFIANPAQLLAQYPDGGPLMISMIRDMAASDPATLPLILGLAAKANADQLDAIGTGLGETALICARMDQAFATQIQQMVAALNNNEVALTFRAVQGDVAINSVDPAEGGVGSVGSSGAAGGGSVGAFGWHVTGGFGFGGQVPNSQNENFTVSGFLPSGNTGSLPGGGPKNFGSITPPPTNFLTITQTNTTTPVSQSVSPSH
jgi:hypothetical protein